MDPSYNNSFGSPIVSAPGAVEQKPKKKWAIIVAVLVVVALIATCVAFVFLKGNGGPKKSTATYLNEYSNYLLYGESSDNPIEIDGLWPVDYYKAQLAEKNEAYFQKLQSLFGDFADSFEKNYTVESFKKEDRFELLTNLINDNKQYLNAAILYLDTGKYTENEDENNISMAYQVNVGIVDNCEWIYSEFKEKDNEE